MVIPKTEKDEGSDNEALNRQKKTEKKDHQQAEALVVDDFVYKVFFEHREIEQVRERQNNDLFEDLLRVRSDAKYESSTLFGGDKFNISSFAPKLKKNQDGENLRRKSPRRRVSRFNFDGEE